MKFNYKYFVIALLFSLILSVSAVAAQEDMTFEQSDIDETLTLSPDVKEINTIEEEFSVDDAENNELLQASDDDQLTAGEGSFSDVQSKIDEAINGSTIYLDGNIYLGNGNSIEIKKNITIIGGSESNPNQYATLDAQGFSSIMQVYNKTNVVLKSIKFINGKSDGAGAAINAQSNLTIEDCHFINNTAQNGGALNLVGHIYHVIRNNDTTWESYKDIYNFYDWYHEEIRYGYYDWEYYSSSPYHDPEKYYYGDYNMNLYIYESFKYNLNNCYFVNNNATQNGGAINIIFGNKIPSIQNCIFSNNTARDGGAIYSPRNYLLEHSKFINNSASNDGGALYSTSISSYYFLEDYEHGSYSPKYSSKINDCEFTDNSATTNGGAIRGYFDRIDNSTFTSNKANNGGAVHASGSIYYSNFTKNSATNNGGAAYSVSLSYCNLIDNTAVQGGAGYSIISFSSNFTNNSASEGGALYSSYVNRCNFNSNNADYGGAVYCMGDQVLNSNFTNNEASDASSAIYISTIYTFDYIKGNNFNSDKTEVVIRNSKDYNGFNIVILDNQTLNVCEGEIKIYATIFNDEGVKFSFEEFIFVVGSYELKTKVIDNYAEIMFNATPQDDGSVIGVKTTSATNAKISTAILNVYPYEVYIEFDDAHGDLGDVIQVPVYVYDSTGHPVSGNISINYNGNHNTLPLENGRVNVTISLPSEKRTLDLIVEYDDVIEIRKVNVLDPDDPVAVIIDMPKNETGYAGRAITVPVNIHDGLGTQLNGDIHVFYNGHEETITLNNGKADIVISLPVYETTFDLGISYRGYNAICKINVEDSTVETFSQIDLAHSASGNISETIKIPVKVVDENGQPLTGDIHVSYYGNELTKSLNSSGEAEISVELPDHETSFELIVNYNGNIKSCVVDVIDPISHDSIVIDVNESYIGYLGKTLNVPVKVTDKDGNPLTGDIHVSYNGHDRTETLVAGMANIEMDLPAAETSFELVVSYKGHIETSLINVVYEGAHIDAVITLPAEKTENINKVVLIPVKVTDSEGNPLEGDVAIYYAGNELTQTLVNGSTAIVIDPISYQTSFELTVAYHAQMAHCFVNVINPDVEPVDAIITLPQNESGHVGKTIVIPVTVVDSEGNPLEGEINIYYNGHMDSETLHNGNASIVMILPDEPTSYNLTVIYNGVSKNCLITVKNSSDDGQTNDTEVVIELNDEYIGHTGKMLNIPISIHDGKGNPLEGTVTLIYDHQYIEHTLNNGATNILIVLPVNPATFDLAVIYEGITKITTIRVFDSNNPMGNITEVQTNGTGSIIIPMPDDATGDVNVTIGGKVYPGKIIDGKIIVNITDLPNGTYTATVIYYGDGNYSYSEKIITIIIMDSTVEDPNSPLANVTEAQTNGDGTVEIPFPKDATGDVIVTINGKNYTGKIIDGRVVLDVTDLPAGNYTSIVYYLGDGNYSSTVKTIVIIKNSTSISPDNPMGNTTQAESNNEGSISIPFPKDATGEVMVEVDGKYYTGRIVDGQVVLDVGNLPMGNYNGNVYYFGDDKYSPSTRTMVFVIKETATNNNQQNTPATPVAAKKASKITAKKKTFKATKKVKKYSITLKSGKTAIKKVKVTIKVGKKTYKAKTNAKGKATFKIKKLTKKGKYTAVIKYKGNKTYKATSKKVKITIK